MAGDDFYSIGSVSPNAFHDVKFHDRRDGGGVTAVPVMIADYPFERLWDGVWRLVVGTPPAGRAQ